MLTTDQKGAIAEAAIVWEATKLGIEVYRPVSEGGRFDMIFLLGERLVRVQCKWAPLLGDTIIIRCYTNRRAREGVRRRIYTAREVDASFFASRRHETISESGFTGLRISSSPLHWRNPKGP